jgi:hypothetical protein
MPDRTHQGKRPLPGDKCRDNGLERGDKVKESGEAGLRAEPAALRQRAAAKNKLLRQRFGA